MNELKRIEKLRKKLIDNKMFYKGYRKIHKNIYDFPKFKTIQFRELNCNIKSRNPNMAKNVRTSKIMQRHF